MIKTWRLHSTENYTLYEQDLDISSEHLEFFSPYKNGNQS